MDDATGRMLNADMEFYKLAGIGDIGEIVVHLDIDRDNDKRGVIGLGEPPATGGIAAISNAVANAIGVRVTTDAADARPRAGRAGKEGKLACKPSNTRARQHCKEALSLLGAGWGDADVLAGGTDLLSLMKDYIAHAEAGGEHQGHQGTEGGFEDRRRACASALWPPSTN